VLHVVANSEHALPACDRVCADNGVYGLELFAKVLRGAAGFGEYFKSIAFSSFVELRLSVGGSK
jgi:hypothetical protein